jgi:hypothetical protein
MAALARTRARFASQCGQGVEFVEFHARKRVSHSVGCRNLNLQHLTVIAQFLEGEEKCFGGRASEIRDTWRHFESKFQLRPRNLEVRVEGSDCGDWFSGLEPSSWFHCDHRCAKIVGTELTRGIMRT